MRTIIHPAIILAAITGLILAFNESPSISPLWNVAGVLLLILAGVLWTRLPPPHHT